MKRQTYFLRNLRSWVTEKNPNAQVIFTSSMDSYAARDGGKQPVTAIKDMFPKYDLDQAANDNFWARQLRKAYQTRLTDKPFPIQDDAQLENVIFAARMHPEENERWRTDILNYIKEVLNQHPPDVQDSNVVLRRLKYTLLPEFSRPTTLELADAAHVAAFHRYLDDPHDGQNTGLRVVPVVYPNGDHAEDAAVPFQPTDANEFHGLLLEGADRDIDLNYIKRLAGLPH
ncbi:hypothetical protein NDA16_002041 [Ustilago loliicola]|nr:hypothetical protein NDA16_002041 [Ustilago loliicola]